MQDTNLSRRSLFGNADGGGKKAGLVEAEKNKQAFVALVGEQNVPSAMLWFPDTQ